MDRLESAVAGHGRRKTVVITKAGDIRGPRYGYAQFLADELCRAGFYGEYTAKICFVTHGSESTRGRLRVKGREDERVVCKVHPPDKDNGGCRYVRIFTPDGSDTEEFFRLLKKWFPAERRVARKVVTVVSEEEVPVEITAVGNENVSESNGADPGTPDCRVEADEILAEAASAASVEQGDDATPGSETPGREPENDQANIWREQTRTLVSDPERLGIFILDFMDRSKGKLGLANTEIYEILRAHGEFVGAPDTYLGKSIIVRLVQKPVAVIERVGDVYKLAENGKNIAVRLGRSPAQILADELDVFIPRLEEERSRLMKQRDELNQRIDHLDALLVHFPRGSQALRG